MAYCDQLQLVGLPSMACPNILTFDHTEKQPEPKSGEEVDPDRLGCITSCRRGLTDPSCYNGPNP